MPPRSAVRVTRSLASEMEEKQKKALTLEKQLTNASATKADSIRPALCEVLADMILTDPASAVQLEVDARLWRNCFYSRIAPWRTRIYKDKKRQNDFSKTQRALYHFLDEAIHLYIYIGDVLQGKLLGALSQTQQSQTQSSIMSDNSSPAEEPDSYIPHEEETQPLMSQDKTGIVELVHRIYIRLGDLYRYYEQYDQAHTSYENAAALGPGHGHTYNQIAVVYQTKEPLGTTAIAVYWYARALAATTDPFETSESNIARLFNDNHEWLKSQQQQQQSSQQELKVVASKSIQTRRFLAHFVDMQRIFYEGQDTEHAINDTIHLVMEKFREHLKASAFGDSLLYKLICIQAFSEWQLILQAQKQESRSSSSRSSQRLAARTASFALARTATYATGSLLAEKVLQSWSHALKNANNTSSNSQNRKQKQLPSARVLGPLVLLTEYVATTHGPPCTPKDEQTHNEARNDFFQKVCLVQNIVLEVSRLYPELQEDANSVVEEEEIPEIYKPFVGFKPFVQIIPMEVSGYVSDEMAETYFNNKRFHLTQNNSQSQQHQSLSDNGKTGSNHHIAMIKNLARVTGSLADLQEPAWTRCFTRNAHTGEVEWKLSSETENDDASTDHQAEVFNSAEDAQGEEMHIDEPEEDTFEMPVDDEHVDEPETLVYQSGPDGGPALLVPGALVAAAASNESSATNKENQHADVEMDHILGTSRPQVNQNIGPPPGLAPPPGFGSVPSNAIPPLAQLPLQPNSQGATTVLETYAATLPVPPTNNPFANNQNTNIPPGLMGFPANQPSSYAVNSPFFQTHSSDDGATLLGSGLLESLWMDDKPKDETRNASSITQNPFAF